MKRLAWLLLSFVVLALVFSPAAAQTPGNLTTGLVSCWDMEEASGTRYDAYGSNDLTDNNTVGQAVGLINNAADFVEANAESLTGSAVSGDVSGYVLVYVPDASTGDNDVFMSTFDYTVPNGWTIKYRDSYFSLSLADGANTVSVNSTTVSSPGWYTVVFDTSTHLLSVDDTDYNGAGTLQASTNGLTFGLQSGGGSPFQGRVDTSALWSASLTSAQRTWLYNSGAGRSCADIIATGAITPTVAAADYYTVTLPSGQIGTIGLSMTTGDIMIASGLVFLCMLAAFHFIQKAVMAIRAASK